MENQGVVSVIICCYNVSHWLETKRLSCILNQSYSNIEIILVDDGSTDNTLPLCRDLATVDGRIKVITKENGGLGSARNVGLDAATGKYVWFYDVDDEAGKTTERMVPHAFRAVKIRIWNDPFCLPLAGTFSVAGRFLRPHHIQQMDHYADPSWRNPALFSL